MRAALQIALTGLELRTPERVVDLCARHWELVLAWNERVNLTAISDNVEAAWLHYRDSLAALPLLTQGPVLDVGSGAGYPGIPLAIALPELQFSLLEPRRKRASFLENAAARLGLNNVRVLNGAIEDAPPELFAAAVTRATFSSLLDLDKCLGWIKPGGKVVAYRSEGVPLTGSMLTPYKVREETRLLEVFLRELEG